ncbi:hypothetical protein BDR05DRAFT_994842 [Suillus weaverae]|nr:hypothetical protein BDR05DRAFT_994842 [Suillus weaverae]
MQPPIASSSGHTHSKSPAPSSSSNNDGPSRKHRCGSGNLDVNLLPPPGSPDYNQYIPEPDFDALPGDLEDTPTSEHPSFQRPLSKSSSLHNNGAYSHSFDSVFQLQAQNKQLKQDVIALTASCDAYQTAFLTLSGQLSLSNNISAYNIENEAWISIKTTSGNNDWEPINLAKKADYPDIKFWIHQDFKQWEWMDGLHAVADRGSLPFLEKHDGNVFSPNELHDIMKTFCSVWFGLTHQDKALASWGKAIPIAKNWLYTKVSCTHPKLALSEGYWKIKAVTTEQYSSWASTHKKAKQTTPHAAGNVDVKPLGHAEPKQGGQHKRKIDSRTPNSASSSSDISITTQENSVTKDLALDCADQPK